MHVLSPAWWLALVPFGYVNTSNTPSNTRAPFTVPSLVDIRGILARLESPIIGGIVQRIAVGTPSLALIYGGDTSATLLRDLGRKESFAQRSHRYDYGRLEYPYAIPQIAPDRASRVNPFPPGRFHQDSFTGNPAILEFYSSSLLPLIASDSEESQPFFFHLDNSTADADAVLNFDSSLLQLLSHRAHIGKIVAEAKYAGNATTFDPLIRARDGDAIRILLTNKTQEAAVMAQADASATALGNAWQGANGVTLVNFVENIRAATASVFAKLISITTDIEIQYLLDRLD